jgi:hypothetical protein
MHLIFVNIGKDIILHSVVKCHTSTKFTIQNLEKNFSFLFIMLALDLSLT